jgi:hypothetical protein
MTRLPNFNNCCEAACIKLWGKPDHITAKELSWNGANGYDRKTFNRQKKLWYHHGEKRGGSTLELIAFEDGMPAQPLKGAVFIELWAKAHKIGVVPDAPPNGEGLPILAA